MKLRFKATLLLFITLTSITFAKTTIEVRFIESAPKDRFIIKNIGECNLSEFTFSIDLTESVGKLIFDTTEAGAGVEVFQPFEIVSGNIELLPQDENSKTVNDGDTILALLITELNAGESATFTIDLDDTLTNSELGMIRVTGSEIENASASILTSDELLTSATFSNKSIATLALTECF